MSLVLVGELNPHGADPRRALWPDPPGCSGARLQRILGLSRETYVSLNRVNLCAGRWTNAEAEVAALRLLAENDKLLLLGNKVARSFGVADSIPFFHPVERRNVLIGSRRWLLLPIPHPSGRCHYWNDLRNAPRTRELLRAMAPEVPWGEALGEA